MKREVLFLLALSAIAFFTTTCKTERKENPATEQTTKATTVSIRLTNEPKKLNPMLTTASWSLQVCRRMYPTLLDYDPFTLELSPVLVKTRPQINTIDEGARKGWTTYTYELLEEARWDDGSAITAEDYVFTLKALFNPNVRDAAPFRSYLRLIKDVTIDPENPKKFTVHTEGKYIKAEYATGLFIFPKYKFDPDNLLGPYQLKDLCDPAQTEQFLNDEKLKTFADQYSSPEYTRDKNKVGGCGPYQLEEWVEGERIVLKKKRDWWGDQLADRYPLLTARPEKLIFRPFSDAVTALTLVKSQELDVMTKVPEAQFEEFMESDIGKQYFEFETPDLLGNFFYAFNTKNPKFEDKKVRRAIAHLVDVDEIIKKVKLGYAEPVVGPFHPSRTHYHSGLKSIELDVEKAKKLLNEAGWTDTNNDGTVDKQIEGEQVEMSIDLLVSSNNRPSINMGIIFQNEAKKAGVRINIIEKANSALVAQLRSRDFDMFARGIGADLSGDDPKQYWHTDSDTPGGSNMMGFGNAQSDALIDAIRTELDEAKRKDLYYRFQEILYEEQPVVFLYSTKDRMIFHKRFKNVKTSIKSPGLFPEYWHE